jgi:Asp-tRNA(Asn)/Glu-tRNA(Gln) amidotransferase A subunit family amidase
MKTFPFISLKAALIGAGASVIGVASDVAGSIRVPAMYNGIFGHKPTPGRSCLRTIYQC